MTQIQLIPRDIQWIIFHFTELFFDEKATASAKLEYAERA